MTRFDDLDDEAPATSGEKTPAQPSQGIIEVAFECPTTREVVYSRWFSGEEATKIQAYGIKVRCPWCGEWHWLSAVRGRVFVDVKPPHWRDVPRPE